MTARRRPGAAFRKVLVSLLDGCTQGGQLIGQPCYPCAIVVWSADMLPMRMCRRRPDDADRSADASKKPVVVRRLAMRTRLWLFKCARNSRARVIPNTHRGRVAAGGAFIEMRRINDISDFGSESTLAIIRHARAPSGLGQPSECRTEFI